MPTLPGPLKAIVGKISEAAGRVAGDFDSLKMEKNVNEVKSLILENKVMVFSKSTCPYCT